MNLVLFAILRIELVPVAAVLIGFGIRRLDREIARGTRRPQ